MKKIWTINLLLVLTISTFAQTQDEVQLNADKATAHSSIKSTKNSGFYSIMQVSLMLGNSQCSEIYPGYYSPYDTYNSFIAAPIYNYPITHNSLTVVPSFTVSAGQRFDEHWAIGAGAGIEIFEQNLFPLFAELRYTLWDNRISPFIVLKSGYSFGNFKSKHYDDLYLSWAPYYVNDAGLRNYGGFMFHPEIGVKVPLKNNTDLMFTAAYRYQKTKTVARKDYQNGLFDEWEHKEDISRLSFGMAIMFR